MTKREYSNVMRVLYLRLKQVQAMTETEACEFMDSESKEEGLQMIQDIIDSYKRLGYK